MQPLKMQPVFKDYLWGGTSLVEQFGKHTDMRPVAESWEISTHPDGESVVQNGPLKGRTLAAVLAQNPGWIGAGKEQLPVMVKLIDARDKLSLQVHPDDTYARAVENDSGKNEIWYVLEAAKGAELILGLREPMNCAALRSAIQDGSILEKLNRVPVHAGECYGVPAGLLHGIGSGTLIAEVQQSSNVTYRAYDYGRVGADGKTRPLHIEKAVEVTDTSLSAQRLDLNPAVARREYSSAQLTDWPYFSTQLLQLNGKAELCANTASCHCLLALSGGLELYSEQSGLSLGLLESAVIPAGLGIYHLQGSCRVLLTSV